MWEIRYHQNIQDDLKNIPKKYSIQIIKAIEHRLQQQSDPTLLGKPLRANLSGYFRIRIGNYRVVYKVSNEKIQIFIIAIGLRRDEEIYELADLRKSSFS
jgi:mRNA interferase RelE/StbE